MSIRTLRDGMALPATLLALVIVGALVTGGVYTAMANDRTSANTEVGQYAFMAAERGLDEVLGTWLRADFQTKLPTTGSTFTVGPVAVTAGDLDAQYTVSVKRLNTFMYMVESDGEIVSGGRYAGAKRRVAQIVRTRHTSFPKDRAVSTHVDLRMVGKAGVSGADTIPQEWSGCPAGVGTRTGVVHDDDAEVKIVGAAGVTGVPKYGPRPLTQDSFLKYGDMHLNDLIATANHTLAAGNYGGMAPSVNDDGFCDTTDDLNWGDPDDDTGPCHLYWPVIYSPGDVTINNGVGQGILIVGGDLQLGGNVEFTGLVFVYGALKSVGSGNKVIGSVSVLGQSPDGSELDATGAGSTMIHLSSCAIERAYLYSDRFARPVPLAERKFVDVSGLGLD